MRAQALILMLAAAGCVREAAPVVNPVERLLGSSRREICDGALAEVLGEVRRPGYQWRPAELERLLRWSFGHNHDDCGGDVSGRALWREAIEALGAQGGEAAGRALISSLRVSHRLSVDPDHGGAGFGQETEAALGALARVGPLSASDANELVTWYEEGAEGCSLSPYQEQVTALMVAAGEAGALALAEHFPPTQEAGRCSSGWLLSEVLGQAPEAVQDQVLTSIRQADSLGDDLRFLLEVVDRSSGRLQELLAQRACLLAVTLARQAFEGDEANPRDAVADTFGACAATEGGPWRTLELQQRLTRWLIAQGEAEEALTTLEAAPAEDVSDGWFSQVAEAVLYHRLELMAPLEAAAMYDQLAARLGPDHADLLRMRETLGPALIEFTERRLEARGVDDARAALEAAEGCCGETEVTRRLALLLNLVEAATVEEGEDCPTPETQERLRDALRGAQETIRESYRDDDELGALLRATSRGWRLVERRCRRRRR